MPLLVQGDLNALNQAAEMASLRYQQFRAAALRAELSAEQASHAVAAARARLVEAARRLAPMESRDRLTSATPL